MMDDGIGFLSGDFTVAGIGMHNFSIYQDRLKNLSG